MCQSQKNNYERRVAEQAKSQPKEFWKFTKTKLKMESSGAPLLADPEDPKTLCHDDKEKAEILQKQFGSVFTGESNALDLLHDYPYKYLTPYI